MHRLSLFSSLVIVLLGLVLVASVKADPLPEVSFRMDSVDIVEDDVLVDLVVDLSASSALTATVDFITVEGTAVAGPDYLSATGTLTFTPGTTLQMIPIQVLEDTSNEEIEDFQVVLKDARNAMLGSRSVFTITIFDDGDLSHMFLPMVIKRWPPIPYAPYLDPINNPDGYGGYWVTWQELPTQLAESYVLEEAKNRAFTDGVRQVCELAGFSCIVEGRVAGSYYYRVKGHNQWGESEWSNVESTNVFAPGVPYLARIDNADHDRDYTVSWSTSPRAQAYILEEDDNSSFSSPNLRYSGSGLSLSISGQPYGTYHYRVAATGPTGQSSWSNVQSVTVPAPPPGVVVLSSNAFVPYSGSSSLYIVGEVLNNTGSNVRFVKIYGTLRNGSGNVVGSDYTYSDISILSPQMTSPFMLIFSDVQPWSTYELNVVWSTTSEYPRVLEVLNRTSYFDSLHAFHVVGEVRNQFTSTREYVEAYVTMYDSAGKVIGVGSTYTNPEHIAPGQTASFDVDCYFWKYKPSRSKVARYLLQVVDD